MAATKRMKRALVSVFHKDGLDEILKKLHSEGVSFVSTGGTQSFIESLGLPCDAVEDLTSYPSILGRSCEDASSEGVRWYLGSPRERE